MYTIKKCSTGATYAAILEKQLVLDLNKVKTKIAKLDYKIIIDVPSLLIVKKEYELSIFPNGKLLFKKLNNKEKVNKLAKEIYKVILK